LIEKEVLMEFADALRHENLEAVRRCPKTDLHNHFVLGGSAGILERILNQSKNRFILWLRCTPGMPKIWEVILKPVMGAEC
jgi:hypothetical protein